MKSRTTRRVFLQVSSAGVAGTTLLGCGGDDDPMMMPPPDIVIPDLSYLTEDEYRVLLAVADLVHPLASAAGVGVFIDRTLAAFDFDPPRIFAGGPFSDRNPFPDLATGEPTTRFPPNHFAEFLPLTRTQELAWRIRLYGSEETAGGDFNTAATGAVRGWRTQYREGLAMLTTEGFLELDPEARETVWGRVQRADPEFAETLVNNVLEGLFSAPEYGGNLELAGWRDIPFDGDSAPMGFSVYAESTGAYREDPDRPVGLPNPDEDFADLPDEILAFLDNITMFAGGERFN